MPAVQRGQVYKLKGGSWAYRYYDAHRVRRQRGGFRTKSEAAAALGETLAEVRLGPAGAVRRAWTVAELVDRYLGQHQAEPATIANLTWKLGKATAAFGEVRVRDLLPESVGA